MEGVIHMRLIVILVSIIIVSGCQITEKPKTAVNVDLHNTVGNKVGKAKLTENPGGVKIKLNVKVLTPGFHGIHIHEEALCEQPGFISAGNHFNPKKKEHGLLYPKGPHLGDLKNVEADKNGKVDTEII